MTDIEIKEFNKRQAERKFHPYTCDRNAKECEVNQKPRDWSKDGVLLATKDFLICPCGKYKEFYK